MVGYVEIQLDNETVVSDETTDTISLEERAGGQMRSAAHEDRRRSRRRLGKRADRRNLPNRKGAVDQIVEGHTGHVAIVPEIAAPAYSPI